MITFSISMMDRLGDGKSRLAVAAAATRSLSVRRSPRLPIV
jgi:hypothetical protein